MEHLPVEIIENILKNPNLTIQDVVNFSSTSHYFRQVVHNSQAIWKQKYRDRFPPEVYQLLDGCTNFLTELTYVLDLKRKTRQMIEAMPPRFYKKYELSDSDLEEWTSLLSARKKLNYHYLVMDLIEIVQTDVSIKSLEVVPLLTPGNKTLQYYANKVLRHLQQAHLIDSWTNFCHGPTRLQILEKGAIFVAQWCQPNKIIVHEEIGRSLDEIANLVTEKVMLQNPQHPLLTASEQVRSQWKRENLSKNQWPVEHCRIIIKSISEVMCKDLGFSGNDCAYYDPQNSFINTVLESRRGLPITLAVIYEAVGRRLGLLLEPISFPGHFLLRFTESSEEWYYIDIYHGGNVVLKNTCPRSRYGPHGQRSLFPRASAAQVVERMANNLELSCRHHVQPNGRVSRLRSILELVKLVSPQDLTNLVSLARLYMLHNMNTRSLEHYITAQPFDAPGQAQHILHMLRDYTGHHAADDDATLSSGQVEVAQRTADLKFAVGMVMSHLSYGYKCVIYDWDLKCLATADWQAEMAVHKLKYKSEQPFYNVLVEDGSYRYVAQENLAPTCTLGNLYLNEDLGRHFSHFFETHYVPNAEKEMEYPGDKKVRHRFYSDMRVGVFKAS